MHAAHLHGERRSGSAGLHTQLLAKADMDAAAGLAAHLHGDRCGKGGACEGEGEGGDDDVAAETLRLLLGGVATQPGVARRRHQLQHRQRDEEGLAGEGHAEDHRLSTAGMRSRCVWGCVHTARPGHVGVDMHEPFSSIQRCRT